MLTLAVKETCVSGYHTDDRGTLASLKHYLCILDTRARCAAATCAHRRQLVM